MMREGTIVDATLIASPPSTKNKDKDKDRDPEMHQSKKGNDWHFGLKAHMVWTRRRVLCTPLLARLRAKVPLSPLESTYRGLAKNTTQLFTLFGFANLVLAGRQSIDQRFPSNSSHFIPAAGRRKKARARRALLQQRTVGVIWRPLSLPAGLRAASPWSSGRALRSSAPSRRARWRRWPIPCRPACAASPP